MTRDKGPRTRTLLLYSQDSKGMGHITRTLTIARHFLATYPKCVGYIATESPIAREFALPERCDYIKLPTRVTVGDEPETETEAEAASQHFHQVRSRILRETVLGLSPDLVLVDHEPLGHKGEFREGLWALKEESPSTKFVFGLRDIMDDPQRIRAQWRELGVYDAFDQLYDGIAVYGSRALYDVADAYALPPSVRAKLQYCGYVVREPPRLRGDAVRARYGLPLDGPLVVATAGSGSDGYPVLAAAQSAIRRMQGRNPDLNAVLVTGPLMPANHQVALRSRETARCRVVSRADNLELVAAANAAVGMGGYNSVCEALVAGTPLVVVPRATHKVEQLIRAKALAEHGLARWIHPMDLDIDKLEAALGWALTRDREAHARLVRDTIPSFDGATRLTAYLSQWLAEDRTRPGPALRQEPSMVQAR